MNLVIIYGPIAAGKLSVAKELRDITGYKLLDNHTVLNAVAALFPFEDPELNKIRGRLSRKFRLEMFEEASKAGVDFITTLIIGSPDSFAFIRETRASVQSHGGHVWLVQLRLTREAVMMRVESESRKRAMKVASRHHLERELVNRPMQFDALPDIPHLVIDNTHIQPKDVARQIATHYQLT